MPAASSTLLRPLDISAQRETVLRLPETARTVFSGVELGQRALLQRAAGIAVFLRERWGVTMGDRVGLLLSPSEDLVPSILGVWMAGAAYVPMDPAFPDERLFQIASDSELRGVITQHSHGITHGLLATRLERPLPSLEVDRAVLQAPKSVSDTLVVPSSLPAYLIYTSGSTGRPKGVVCTFGGLENLVSAVRAPLGLDASSRHLQFASLCFDASVWDIFPTLFAGGTVVQATREELLPGKRMAGFLREERVTHLCLPPSVLGTLSAFRDTLPDLRSVVMAGERCPPPLAQHWRQTTRVVNAYGPTEATVCATLHEVSVEEDPVPIGRALENVALRIVDAGGRDCPDGTAGELWVGGPGVAAGYRGQVALTGKCFPCDASGAAWYRTGDEVVRRADGELLFVGRLDHQVKLRGFRIELGAIEQALYGFPGVAQAAARTFEDVDAQGLTNGILAAYFSVAEGATVSIEALRSHLAATLPDYMVPHHFVPLPELPLMANGSKVDVKALPAPAEWARVKSDDAGAEETPPALGTPLERLTRAFAHALSAPAGSVTPETQFFEAGGDSFGVAQVLTRIEEDFGIALPSRIVYAHPTPASLLAICLGEEAITSDPDEVRVELLRDARWEAPALDQRPRVEGLPRTVLLTGATGFLGSHLAAALASRLERVICLVRASSDADAATRVREAAARFGVESTHPERLVAVAGDITEESLGFTPEQYLALATQADAIVHAAANISYILPYADAGKPNARGTRNILEFACTGRVKPIHHVSSMSVYGATATLLGQPVVDETFDIDDSLDIVGFENGYTRAKWVAEKMLGAAREAGLPVSIYRPGFIQGDTRTGLGNPDDLFCRLLVGNIQRGTYPDFPLKYWLPVPVDFVAQAMAHLVCTRPPGETYNLLPARDQEPSNNALFEMARALGYPMEKVAPDVWLRELAQLGPDNALFPLVGFLREKVYRNQRTVLEMHYATSEARADATLAALEGSGLACPDIDLPLIEKYLARLFQKYAKP